MNLDIKKFLDDLLILETLVPILIKDSSFNVNDYISEFIIIVFGGDIIEKNNLTTINDKINFLSSQGHLDISKIKNKDRFESFVEDYYQSLNKLHSKILDKFGDKNNSDTPYYFDVSLSDHV